MSQFLRGATGLKVKEVPGYVQKYAVQNWTPAQLQSRFSTWLQNYKTQVRMLHAYLGADRAVVRDPREGLPLRPRPD